MTNLKLCIELNLTTIEDPDNNPLLIQTVKNDQYSSMEFLVANQYIDINKKHPRGGYTALHLAAVENKEYCITQLLAHQADPQIKDSIGKTAFDYTKDPSNAQNILGQATFGHLTLQTAKEPGKQ